MGGVQLDDDGEILNGDFNFTQLFIGAPHYVIGSYVALVDVQQTVAVLDGFLEQPLFHKGTGTYEQGFTMGGVGLEFGSADADEVIDVDLVAVKMRSGLGGSVEGLTRTAERGERG